MPVIAGGSDRLQGLLKFENVTFGYREGQNILRNSSFSLEQRQDLCAWLARLAEARQPRPR